MSYPPAAVAADKTDGTAVTTDHPAHHNSLANAVNTIVAELGTAPHGVAADLTARLTALDTTVAAKLAKASNLSDLADVPTARSNLGLGSLATQSGTFSGTSSGTNTGDQTITLTGDITGSGTGSFATAIGSGKVTSAMIVDGTIVDADINASAAIAQSKINGLGTAASVADSTLVHLAGTEVLTGGKTLNALTLGGDQACGAFGLVNVGKLYIGSATDTSGGLQPIILVASAPTETAGGTRSGLAVTGTTTFSTTAGGSYLGVNATPVISTTVGLALMYGLKFDATVNGSATTTSGIGGFFRYVSGASHTTTTATGIYSEVRAGLGTVTTGIGVDVASSNALGTFTTMIGLRITGLAGGSTVWGLQIGAYSSYHQGKFTLGGTTAGTWLLHVQGGNAATSGVGLDISTTGPTAPASNGSVVISAYKGTNYFLLLTFNDGGTTRYKSLQMNGTGTTWAQGTSLPT